MLARALQDGQRPRRHVSLAHSHSHPTSLAAYPQHPALVIHRPFPRPRRQLLISSSGARSLRNQTVPRTLLLLGQPASQRQALLTAQARR